MSFKALCRKERETSLSWLTKYLAAERRTDASRSPRSACPTGVDYKSSRLLAGYYLEEAMQIPTSRAYQLKAIFQTWLGSGQHIDRLCAAFRACKRAGRIFVLDIYTAYILRLVSTRFENVPDFTDKHFRVLKRTSIPYAGVEKNGVQEVVKANNNIIDLEVALTQEADDREKDDQGNVEKEDPSNPRIDFTALKQKSTGIELQFFEAKHFSYTSVLRKRGKKDPKVIKQINDYEVLLKKYAPDIIKSYRTVCKKLL